MPDQMQQDALRRVQQMYSNVHQSATTQPTDKHTHNTPDKNNNKNTTVPHSLTDGAKPHSKASPNLLDMIMQDKDRSLIILVMIILLSENVDTSLILALMYLII